MTVAEDQRTLRDSIRRLWEWRPGLRGRAKRNGGDAEFVSLDTVDRDWSRVYWGIWTRGLRRAGLVLLAIPLGVVLELFSVLSAPDSILGSVASFLGALVILGLVVAFIYEFYRCLHGKPFLVRCEVLKKIQTKAGTATEVLMDQLLHRELIVDVESAFRVTTQGAGAPLPDFVTCRRLDVTRSIYRRVEAGDKAVLLCSGGGRALGLLGDIPIRRSAPANPSRAAKTGRD